MRTQTIIAALAAGLLGASGCIFVDSGPELRITQLRVTGESDFGMLDVEVHLFDASTHQFLGCSGEQEGLEHVDDNDLTYRVDAWFRHPDHDMELEPSDVRGRLVEVQVIEDDVAPCPAPPGIDDDVIGISPALTADTFDARPVLAFDRVPAIQIVID